MDLSTYTYGIKYHLTYSGEIGHDELHAGGAVPKGQLRFLTCRARPSAHFWDPYVDLR